MIATEVQFSSLTDRVDAGFYTTKIEIEEQLKISRVDFKNMETLCKFPRAKTPARIQYTDSGVPVIKLKNITNYFINWSDTSFIPERIYSNFLQPKKGDILITATGEGTIGRVNIFDEDKKCIVTGEIMVARPNPQKINPYFLLTYLSCKYGKPQLIRFVRGATGQTHLYSKDVKQILVPIPLKPFQADIEKLIKEAHTKKNLADQKYKEAEQLLYKELGIDKLELRQNKTFETTFSELEKTMRFDVQFYHPKYKKMVQILDNLPDVRIIKEISKKKPVSGATPLARTNAYIGKKYGVPFIRIVDIKNHEIDLTDVLYIREDIHNGMLKRSQLKPNDLLISIAGTIGLAVVVPKELDKANINQAWAKIELEEGVNPYYVALFFNSKLGKLQSERFSRPVVQANINLQELSLLKVPLVSKSKQDKISDLIKESFDLRKESKSLLDQAKHEVEELIKRHIK